MPTRGKRNQALIHVTRILTSFLLSANQYEKHQSSYFAFFERVAAMRCVYLDDLTNPNL